MKANNTLNTYEFIFIIDQQGEIVFESNVTKDFCNEFGIELNQGNILESDSLTNEPFLDRLYKKIQVSSKYNETINFDENLTNNSGKTQSYRFQLTPIKPPFKREKCNIVLAGKKQLDITSTGDPGEIASLGEYDLQLAFDSKGVVTNYASKNAKELKKKIVIGKTLLRDIIAKSIFNFVKSQLKLIDKQYNIIEKEFELQANEKKKILGIRLSKVSKEYWLAVTDISTQANRDNELRKFVEELHYNKIISEQYAKELTLVNKQLNESQKQLQEININKDKFFSIVAHDLRNPFSALLGFSEFLAKEADDLTIDEIKEYSNSINSTGRHLLALLENLLTWSRVQLGRLEFEPDYYDLSEQLYSLYNYFVHLAKQKGITLNFDIDEDITVFADSNMIHTVLRNLITNSIKFTHPSGSVNIKACFEKKQCIITVSDTGVGISSEDKQKLFKIESHHSTEGTNREKGSGLGLIICNEFVLKNNGLLEYESIEGKGTVFTVKLPRTDAGKLNSSFKTANSKTKKTSGYKFSK